jgi:hypothetical protein
VDGLSSHHGIDCMRDSVHPLSAAHRRNPSGGIRGFSLERAFDEAFIVTSIVLAAGGFRVPKCKDNT